MVLSEEVWVSSLISGHQTVPEELVGESGVRGESDCTRFLEVFGACKIISLDSPELILSGQFTELKMAECLQLRVARMIRIPF